MSIVNGSFSYVGKPTVTSVTPTAGPLTKGKAVKISGTGFTTTTSVEFGTTAAASYTVNTNSTISAIAPAAPGGVSATKDVRVSALGGTSTLSGADTYTWDPAPTVTSVAPAKGALGGGGTITIKGTGFTQGRAGRTTVQVASFQATNVVVASTGNQMTAALPAASTPGSVSVTVTTPGGSAVATNAITYVGPPTLNKVTPSKGPLAGGTTVTITGTNFVTVTHVRFGTSTCSTVHVVSPTKLTAKDPAGSGAVAVSVTTTFGTATKPSGFTYVPAPSITSLSRTGPMTGGNTVTITGTNFITVSMVRFGTTTARTFTVRTSGQIVATAPAHAAGTVRVSVAAAGGTTPANASDLYRYFVPPPEVTTISPASGPPAGGTTVTVNGSGFTGATKVYFGTSLGSLVSVNAAGTQLTVKSPTGTAGTSVNVRVVTPGGTSPTVSGDLFTYGPTVKSLSRTTGPVAGGTKITITGSGFTTVEHVNFGTATSTFTVKSANQIAVTAPAHAAGQVRISVTTAAGTTPTTTADLYRYN
jgi:hypothetical protein